MSKNYKDEKVFGRIPKTKPYKKNERKKDKINMNNLKRINLDDYRDENDRDFD